MEQMAAEHISVKVRYFASLREQRGVAEEALELEAGLCLGALWEQLAQRHGLRQQQVLMALNHVYARPQQELAAGDEVAFFPPVTGG